jgi:nucleotide-binding universal stress UspA family protein
MFTPWETPAACVSHRLGTTSGRIAQAGEGSTMYDAILVPTDGSDGCEPAIDTAIEMAKQYDAALHTLYVVETASFTSGLEREAMLETLVEAGHEAVDTVTSQAEVAGVESVEGSVKEGVAHRTIISYGEDHDIDLVVMGTHGRTGLGRYMLGSVTENVVRLADVPVLTVPIGEDDGS